MTSLLGLHSFPFRSASMQVSTPQIPLPIQVMEQNQKEFLPVQQAGKWGPIIGTKWEKEAGGMLTVQSHPKL